MFRLGEIAGRETKTQDLQGVQHSMGRIHCGGTVMPKRPALTTD